MIVLFFRRCYPALRRREKGLRSIGSVRKNSRETTKFDEVLSVLVAAVLQWCSHLSLVRCAFVSSAILLDFAGVFMDFDSRPTPGSAPCNCLLLLLAIRSG